MLAGSKFSRLSNFKRLSLQDALHNSVKGTTGNNAFFVHSFNTFWGNCCRLLHQTNNYSVGPGFYVVRQRTLT